MKLIEKELNQLASNEYGRELVPLLHSQIVREREREGEKDLDPAQLAHVISEYASILLCNRARRICQDVYTCACAIRRWNVDSHLGSIGSHRCGYKVYILPWHVDI